LNARSLAEEPIVRRILTAPLISWSRGSGGFAGSDDQSPSPAGAGDNAACEPQLCPRQVPWPRAHEGGLFCPPDGAHGEARRKGARTAGDVEGAPDPTIAR